MMALMTTLVLLLGIDQGLKILVLQKLAATSISLGSLGDFQLVKSRVWLARQDLASFRVIAWPCWLSAAAILLALTCFLPTCGWSAGAILGGSLSHLLETTMRGFVVDYICLRFWPAFNFADLTMAVGAVALLFQLLMFVAGISS